MGHKVSHWANFQPTIQKNMLLRSGFSPNRSFRRTKPVKLPVPSSTGDPVQFFVL
uniref:Uncharacterized protein n=1 Tax=Arundo donax TaxID=35708 RepID=A0A0A8Z8A8_ARUDO